MANDLMEKIISLCKRRGFIFPGSGIYGGMANSWDYGPLGVELKNNIKKLWWNRFVQGRDDMVGIDSALIMNPKVWEASGHLENFSDPLVECKKCHYRFRPNDEIPGFAMQPTGPEGSNAVAISHYLEDHTCKSCGNKGNFTVPLSFNLMLKTFIGPAEEKANIAYFRPETAQAMFVDFKQVADSMRMRVPFGIAQIGKAFRNEITPGNFIFRTREFEQMEIEYFVRPSEATLRQAQGDKGVMVSLSNHDKWGWEQWFEYWLEEMKKWLKEVGVKKGLHYVEIPDGERAHYSKRTIDIEYEYPFGQKELYGIAYRTDFDLGNHKKASGQDLSYRDPVSGEKFIPHVIEPTFGVDRTFLAVLLESYSEIEGGRTTTTESIKEVEVVLRLPKVLAPVKVAVLPLSKKPQLEEIGQGIAKELRKYWTVQYDVTASIGKRYRRQDEIGTPYCVTVDFESVEDKKVTVRERDSMKQERVGIGELGEYLSEQFISSP